MVVDRVYHLNLQPKIFLKHLRWTTLVVMALCVALAGVPVRAAPAEGQVKELNLVFLHGVGGTTCAFQLLADTILEEAVPLVSDYEQANPGVTVQINTLQRCYPSNVDLDTWARNVADAIDKHFQNRKNLILIGHSMGGKTALYAVANNIANLAEKVAMVVTINSPVKSLDRYYLAGGISISDYLRARYLVTDQGALESVAYYDSSSDGNWVARNKHWLAFISAESAPASPQFDRGNVDTLPRDMDDGIVPISAQYADQADVVYYGQYAHSDFSTVEEVARHLADQLLRYIFGGSVDATVFVRSDTFAHQAGWLPSTYRYTDVLGESLATHDIISHVNHSFFRTQEWDDIVGACTPGKVRSSYRVSITRPFVTSILEARWVSPAMATDCRLFLRTRAAPRASIRADWSVYEYPPLPPGTSRDHYEIKILAGTTFTNIPRAGWTTNDPTDTRITAVSEAQGPLRSFRAEWRVYSTQSRYRKIIDEIPPG